MNRAESPIKIWGVRAGPHGEDEQAALDKGIAIIGFRDMGALTEFSILDDIRKALRSVDPTAREARVENRARQLNAFKNGISLGDTILLPLKTRPGLLAMGRVTGPYRYREINGERRHTRDVNWIRLDAPRSVFQQDLLYSLGAFLTVFRITRNDAERRVGYVMEGGPDPGYLEIEVEDSSALTASGSGLIDTSQAAHDEITSFVRSRFSGHDMARLVEAILQAEGFNTHRSPPGPDGGADILAARGSLGLDEPTLCVQVKATDSPADVTIFRALQGTMESFGASQGLLVCWGGFTQALKNEARQHTFRVRLWNQSDLVLALNRAYEQLSEEFQAELPLKKAWILVREDPEAAD